MNRKQIAIIGCGRIAPNHVSSLKKIPACEVALVIDVIEERARNMAEKYQIPHYSTTLEAIGENTIDGVVIATPPGTHREVLAHVSQWISHCFCEKPLSTTLHEVEEIGETIKKQGTHLTLGFMLRYSKAFAFVEKLIESSLIGDLRMIRGLHFINTQKMEWWWDPVLSGGIVTESMIHHINLAQALAGGVTEVSVNGIKSPESGLHPFLSLGFQHRSGVLTSLCGGYLPEGAALPPEQFQVVGSQGWASIESIEKVRYCTNTTIEEIVFEGSFGYLEEQAAFVSSLFKEKALPTDYEDAHATHIIVDQVQKRLEEEST